MRFVRRRFLTALAGSAAAVSLRKTTKAFEWFSQDTRKLPSGQPQTHRPRPLRAIIVYYSASGNTGRIADAIRRGMTQLLQCDIAPIEKMDPKNLATYDVIAIGGPVWHFRAPANLRLYAYRMPQLPGRLGVLFCTHAVNPNSLFYDLGHILAKKDVDIIGWNDWFGEIKLSLHTPQPDPVDGHPDEIDLKEAEVFGRKMAERAQRIYAGETNLIPEIPTGPNADSLWQPRNGTMQTTPILTVGAATKRDPVIDTAKCVYPRCTACIDNCVANAIDLSVTGSAAAVSNSPVLVKGCLHCSPANCIRSCAYDAITYEQTQQVHVIDMKKCTYPKCTLCVDHCPMHTIDFTHNPPAFHKNCEGCDVCYMLCPTRALDITNFAETHDLMSQLCDPKHPTGTCHGADTVHKLYLGFYSRLNEATAKGKFRPLVPIEKIGWSAPLSSFKRMPYFTRKEENWPYHISTG